MKPPRCLRTCAAATCVWVLLSGCTPVEHEFPAIPAQLAVSYRINAVKWISPNEYWAVNDQGELIKCLQDEDECELPETIAEGAPLADIEVTERWVWIGGQGRLIRYDRARPLAEPKVFSCTGCTFTEVIADQEDRVWAVGSITTKTENGDARDKVLVWLMLPNNAQAIQSSEDCEDTTSVSGETSCGLVSAVPYNNGLLAADADGLWTVEYDGSVKLSEGAINFDSRPRALVPIDNEILVLGEKGMLFTVSKSHEVGVPATKVTASENLDGHCFLRAVVDEGAIAIATESAVYSAKYQGLKLVGIPLKTIDDATTAAPQPPATIANGSPGDSEDADEPGCLKDDEVATAVAIRNGILLTGFNSGRITKRSLSQVEGDDIERLNAPRVPTTDNRISIRRPLPWEFSRKVELRFDASPQFHDPDPSKLQFEAADGGSGSSESRVGAVGRTDVVTPGGAYQTTFKLSDPREGLTLAISVTTDGRDRVSGTYLSAAPSTSMSALWTLRDAGVLTFQSVTREHISALWMFLTALVAGGVARVFPKWTARRQVRGRNSALGGRREALDRSLPEDAVVSAWMEKHSEALRDEYARFVDEDFEVAFRWDGHAEQGSRVRKLHKTHGETLEQVLMAPTQWEGVVPILVVDNDIDGSFKRATAGLPGAPFPDVLVKALFSRKYVGVVIPRGTEWSAAYPHDRQKWAPVGVVRHDDAPAA